MTDQLEIAVASYAQDLGHDFYLGQVVDYGVEITPDGIGFYLVVERRDGSCVDWISLPMGAESVSLAGFLRGS